MTINSNQPLDVVTILARLDASGISALEVGIGRTYEDNRPKTIEYFVRPPHADISVADDICEPDTGKPSEALAEMFAHAPTDIRALVAEVLRLRTENERLTRACVEGLPREVLHCPACGAQHIEGPRHDDPTLDGRVRPHHTHRCYGCGHVWDAGRWSYGDTEASIAAPLADVQRLREVARAYLAAEDEYAEVTSPRHRKDGSFGAWAKAREVERGLQAAREALKAATVPDANGAPCAWPVAIASQPSG